MARKPSVWWHAQKRAWFTDFGGQRRLLAKGRKAKTQAIAALKTLLQERELLDGVHGAITVAALCDAFLEDAHQHLERATYESYKYGCQKLVDHLGGRAAHTIGWSFVAPRQSSTNSPMASAAPSKCSVTGPFRCTINAASCASPAPGEKAGV